MKIIGVKVVVESESGYAYRHVHIDVPDDFKWISVQAEITGVISTGPFGKGEKDNVPREL